MNRIDRLQNNIRYSINYFKQFRFKPIVISAGMPRSGSTLLFNCLRLLFLEKYGSKLSSGWIEETESFPNATIYLIKTHHLNKIDLLRAKHTFYTYRDLRDAMVSKYRMFGTVPSIENVRYTVNQYNLAKSKADLIFKYEDFVNDKNKMIDQLSEILGISVDSSTILKSLPNPGRQNKINSLHDKETLLHEKHVTGTQKGEWKSILPKTLIDDINQEFGWWFKENGYDL
ncbi:MAG: hypothetical protein ACOCWW_03655 [Bacteroidota bacterium]